MRAASAVASRMPRREEVVAALADVNDPELPMVSIVDLGMLEDVSVDGGTVRVALRPTFVGCPAIELIRDAVADRLAVFGRPTEVVASFRTPWTADLISPAGRAALRSAGIAPPAGPGELRCPLCGAADVLTDNLFGPTPCRSIHYCRACRQPFEAIKPV